MKKRFPDACYVDLLDPEMVRSFSAKPERLAEVVRGQGGQKCFVIDEIQKVPELLSVIHQLIEEKQGYTFVLAGSSARKLKRTGVDMLGGRALLRTMHPFLASELGERFRLEEALQRGLLPLVYSSANPDDVLRSYAALYLREEVQMEGQALEGLVAQHLMAWLAYSQEKSDLYFWRTRSGVEVDFVVYGPPGLWALEVKNTATIRPADLRGLKSFRNEYPESRAILLYRGRERILREGILCRPCGDFLIHLLPGKTIDDACRTLGGLDW